MATTYITNSSTTGRTGRERELMKSRNLDTDVMIMDIILAPPSHPETLCWP